MSKSAAALGPQDAFPLLVPSLLSSKPCKERTAGWERILRAVKGSETRLEAETPGLGGTLAAVNGTPPTATPQAAGRILCYPGPGLQRLTYFAVFMNEGGGSWVLVFRLESVTLHRRSCCSLHANS